MYHKSLIQYKKDHNLAPPAYILSVENGQATYAKQQLEWTRQGVISPLLSFR
jgi:hypothetical protein